MLIIFIFALIGFISLVSFIAIQQIYDNKKTCCHFYVGKFSLTDNLENIIRRKLNNEVALLSFIDRYEFRKLNLIDAPVYVLQGKNLNDAHINLYIKAFERINVPFNLIVLDRVFCLNNKYINTIFLKQNKLNVKEIGLINSLNINKTLNQKQSFEFNVNNPNISTDEPIKTHLDLKNLTYFIKTQNENNISITLPVSPFPYFLKGKKGDVEIVNAFNEIILKLYGVNNVKITSNKIYIKANKHTIAINDFVADEKITDIQLLNFDIKMLDYPKISKLKEQAIESLSNNIFAINSTASTFKFKDLNEFLKLAFLRKRYFNDYLILLKDILGLSLNNGVLNVRPKSYVCSDFVISYKIDNVKYNVKFSPVREDNKFNFVSHKLGGKDNITIGF